MPWRMYHYQERDKFYVSLAYFDTVGEGWIREWIDTKLMVASILAANALRSGVL